MPELPAYILLQWCPQPLINFYSNSTWKNSFYFKHGIFSHIICKLINEFCFFFLPALGLHCFALAVFSCGEQGLLPSCGTQASPWGGLSCCRAWVCGLQLFRPVGSVVVACQA